MFDNNFIGLNTPDWAWNWSEQIDTCYEWIVFAAIAGGFYLFMLNIPKRLPRKFSIRHIFLALTVAALLAFLISTEWRAHISQLVAQEDLERNGVFVCWRYGSTLFRGYWYKRVILLIGLACAVLGATLTLFQKVGVIPVAGSAK